jgi:hypothetical protein
MSESSKRARDQRRVRLSSEVLRCLGVVMDRAEYLAGTWPELERLRGWVGHVNERKARAIDIEAGR